MMQHVSRKQGPYQWMPDCSSRLATQIIILNLPRGAEKPCQLTQEGSKQGWESKHAEFTKQQAKIPRKNANTFASDGP